MHTRVRVKRGVWIHTRGSLAVPEGPNCMAPCATTTWRCRWMLPLTCNTQTPQGYPVRTKNPFPLPVRTNTCVARYGVPYLSQALAVRRRGAAQHGRVGAYVPLGLGREQGGGG